MVSCGIWTYQGSQNMDRAEASTARKLQELEERVRPSSSG